MRVLLGLVVACLALTANGLPMTLIIGGYDAPTGKFPYQVSLRLNNRHFCGGSIINNRTILTAAHCVIGKTHRFIVSRITVHAGTNLLNQFGTVYRAQNITHHKNFHEERLTNDIAIITLSSYINYTKLIQPISPAIRDIATPGRSCILSGWGFVSINSNNPIKLQEIKLVVYDNKKCKRTHNFLQASQMCTYTRKGQGACFFASSGRMKLHHEGSSLMKRTEMVAKRRKQMGDSGGPLVVNGTQIGIVSYGYPCGAGYPDVYTRVSAYKEWLKQNIISQ